jgi:hypothetical protein
VLVTRSAPHPGRNSDGEEAAREHLRVHLPHAVHRGGAENGPLGHEEVEGDEHEQRASPPGELAAAVAAPVAVHAVHGDAGGVPEPEDHEGPPCPVPYADDEEGDEQIHVGAGAGDLGAAEGHVQVVLHPAREGDVPATPEVDGAGALEGAIEVLGQLEAEEARRAAGDVGVAGEVAVELPGVGVNGDDDLGGAEGARVVEDAIDEVGGQEVRDEYLLDETHEDEEEAFAGALVVEGGLYRELGQELGSADDGPRHELGEECDEGGELEEGAVGRDAPAVDVDGVAEGLERVEGDAHRQHEVEHRRLHRQAHAREAGAHGRHEEVGVLEEAERAQVAHQAQRDQRLAQGRALGAAQGGADVVIEERGADDEEEERRVPRHVEHVAGPQQQHGAHEAKAHHRPEEREDDAQKERVLEAVEQHGAVSPPLSPRVSHARSKSKVHGKTAGPGGP